MKKCKEKNVITLPIEGTQHRTIPAKMGNTYMALYNALKENYEMSELACSFPYEGDEYWQTLQLARMPSAGELMPRTDEEIIEKFYKPAVRLMVVGEGVLNPERITAKTAEEFCEMAADNIVYGCIQKMENVDKGNEKCVRKIVQELKPFAEIDEEWQEYIVWTDLYPIRWKDGRLDEKMKAIQEAFAKEIFKRQIEYYRPTHVLILVNGERNMECLEVAEIGGRS